MIRVVIAEDHHLVRQGLRFLLEQVKDIQVIGEAENGQEAVSLAQDLKPDVMILDINMPLLDGIEATKTITERGLTVQILILSMYADESLVKKAFRNGARGYVLKNSVAEDLIQAIRQVSTRQMYLSPIIAHENSATGKALFDSLDEMDPVDELTQRERQVCRMIADGKTNQAIATELGISVKTVEKHRSSLMAKLGVSDTASLVRAAIQHRLIFIEGS